MVIYSLYKSYKNSEIAKDIVDKINKTTDTIQKDNIRIMHVCGTHEHTISHGGIRSLLHNKIEVISGPGCPVCICPSTDIEHAVWLSKNDYVVATFGDMSRVPSPKGSLLQSKATNGKVETVYSFLDAIKLARNNKNKNIVFFAIGFETTAPMVAIELLNTNLPKNLSVLCTHRLVPPALTFLLNDPEIDIDGFIAPGHVSVITGTGIYKPISDGYNVPCVVAGFEPVDILLGILATVKQIKEGKGKTENIYPRAVTEEGNLAALNAMDQAYDIVDSVWRGIGTIPQSGYELKEEFSDHNIRKITSLPSIEEQQMPKGCRCSEVILGKIMPKECPLFLSKCKPEDPIGPCMVGDEGTCQIHAKFGGQISFK